MPDPRPQNPLEGLLGIAAGRVTSLLLELAIEHEVFAKLSGRAVPLAEVAGLWGMPAPSARLLAQYLATTGLLVYRDGALANGPLAQAVLTADSEARQALALLFRYDLSKAELHDQLLNPPALHWYQLRDSGEITDTRPLLRQEQENWIGELAKLRHGQRVRLGQELATLYDFSGHRKLMDLGGASGGYCVGIRKQNPHLSSVVFDLPEAAEVATAKIAEEGESEHVEVVAGSFFTADLPAGADVALIANALHLWSVEDERFILRKIHDALVPGGALLVRETYFEDDWTGSLEPVFDAFLLVGREGESGWQPSYAEMEQLLRETGYVDVERRRNLVLGRKPDA
jgi:SAM-dependent methyltransferase